MKKEKKSFAEKYKKQIIAIAIAIVLLIGGTYAWLQLSLTGTKTTKIEAGTLKLTLDESASEGINVEGALPMTDEEGLQTEAYTFSVENTGTITSEYILYLDDDDEAITSTDTRMEDSVVKYSLVKNEGVATTALVSTLTNRQLTQKAQIEPGITDTYTLRLWIKDTAKNEDVQQKQADGRYIGKVFAAKLRIEASQIKE